MITGPEIALLLIGVIAIGLTALFVVRALRSRRALQARLELGRPATKIADPARSPLARIGDLLIATPLIGSGEGPKLRQTLYAAGFVSPSAVGRLIGTKIVGGGLLGALAVVWIQTSEASLLTSAAALLGALLLGLRAPDMVVAHLAKSRRGGMERGLPDVLDLLVVCGEAGIGLDNAIERVSIELKQAHAELAKELGITVSEMRMLPDRLVALRNMGDRVGLESVRSIASTLIQTMRYGTPLGKALRVLSADIRLERQTVMEQKAARLPVLITMPIIVFILPATTLVVAGPAFLQLFSALSKLGGNG